MSVFKSCKLPRAWIFVILTILGVLVAYPCTAQEGQAADPEKEDVVQAPGLAELMPMASSLYGRLAALQKRVLDLPDISRLENEFFSIDSSLAGPAAEIEEMEAAGRFSNNRRLEIRGEISRLSGNLDKVGEPLKDSIRLLDELREDWLAEKTSWELRRSSLEPELEIEQVSATFEEVNRTIETALSLIHSRIVPMLKAQGTAGKVREKIIGITAELDIMIENRRREDQVETVPPMLTSEYRVQLKSAFHDTLRNLRSGTFWPSKKLLADQGWTIALQVLLSLLLIVMLRRNRERLAASDRWRFLAERPVSAGFFFVSIAAVAIYAYGGAPGIVKLVNISTAALTFVRLSAAFEENAWKRKASAWIMATFILASATDVFWIPFPLLRMYAALISLTGLWLCFRWVTGIRRSGGSQLTIYFLRLCMALFVFILVAEIRGSGSVPTYLLNSLFRSFATVLIFTVFLYIIHGGIEWLFRRGATTWQSSLLKGVDTESLIRRTSYFADFAIYGLILVPGLLMIWGAYGSLSEATRGLLSLGFDIGSKRYSIGLLIVAVAILYGTFFISWIIRRSMMATLLSKYSTEKGVRLSIARLIHYLIVFIGFLVIISVLGVDISKLTIMISALGVGIGFGLQGIVNNFVSGLILLFERPIRVGDYIEVGGKWVEVRRIGIRSTYVYTFDKTDMIIPNADLISNQVTNWTLSNRLARLIIKVGVAYGSDVELVMSKLLECAGANEKVAGSPPPRVLFLEFGSSSLDFELWIYVLDAGNRLTVQSELHQEIDSLFREAGIEIAFQQVDLRLRGVEEGSDVQVRETGSDMKDDKR